MATAGSPVILGLFAQVKDDNKTLVYDLGGRDLDGENAPNGGLVDVIFEGTDFDNVQHRQVIATLAPSAGVISLPESQPDTTLVLLRW